MVAPSGRFEARLAEGKLSAIEMVVGGAWADPPAADPTEGTGPAALVWEVPGAACEMVVGSCPCATARERTARRMVVL